MGGCGVWLTKAYPQEAQTLSEKAPLSQEDAFRSRSETCQYNYKTVSYKTDLRSPVPGGVQAGTEFCGKSGDDLRAHCVEKFSTVCSTVERNFAAKPRNSAQHNAKVKLRITYRQQRYAK